MCPQEGAADPLHGPRKAEEECGGAAQRGFLDQQKTSHQPLRNCGPLTLLLTHSLTHTHTHTQSALIRYTPLDKAVCSTSITIPTLFLIFIACLVNENLMIICGNWLALYSDSGGSHAPSHVSSMRTAPATATQFCVEISNSLQVALKELLPSRAQQWGTLDNSIESDRDGHAPTHSSNHAVSTCMCDRTSTEGLTSSQLSTAFRAQWPSRLSQPSRAPKEKWVVGHE